MADSPLAHLPVPLPDVVTLTSVAPRFSANELRMLKAQTGRTMEDLLGPGAEDADRWQTMAWLELRRAGHDVSWQDAGDVQVAVVDETPDPTNGGPSTSSPGSAATGG